MKVQNMTSNRSGREVANQFLIHDDSGNSFFQSYDTIIAKIAKNGTVTLDRNSWDCSVTTGKYRNQFLGETIKETREHIENGDYALADLNE
jgi:hypothetical protein